MICIARSLLSIAILVLTACSSGGELTVQPSPAATEHPAVPTTTPTAQPLPVVEQPTAPSVAPTAQPSPVTENPTAPSVAPTTQPSPVAENHTTIVQPASSAGLCQNPYYPVVQGASWTYQVSGTSSGTFTRSIVNIRENGFDDQDVFSAGVTRQGRWECREGNLISLTPGSVASVIASGDQANFTVESNTGITFPADPRPGTEWTQTIIYRGQQTISDTNLESRNVLNMSCKAIGIENVSVPAGDFEALRVDCTTQLDISISVPLAMNLGTTVAGSAWYASGVGWIKSRDTGEMGVTEVVLLSYTIP
jgi:hypothetical protein